jgi:translocation and assembly module TamA
MSLGGNFKYTTRAELEVPLISKWGISAVGFVDMGGIYAPGRGTSGLSAGLGLVWRSPIGPLRLDWAVPVDGPAPRWGFNIGL